MRNYRLNIDKMLKWLMPFFMIKPKHYAWLQTLFLPVKIMHTEFLQFRQEQLRDATITSEVIRFTRALRDKFNDETIYLLHPSYYLDQAFVYLENEGAIQEFDYLASENHEPVDYDYLQVEYDSDYDFIIRIPQYLVGSSPEILAFAKKYVFTGISYTIETF